jgi:LuxR family maltose regulon positive regulatory protein
VFGQGKLREAAEAYEKAIELAGDDPVTGMAHQGLGSVYYQWNDLEASAEHFKRAIELHQYTKNWALESTYLGLAGTHAAAGDRDGAAKALEDADHLRSELGLNVSSRVVNAGVHAGVALLLGDKEAAFEWTDGLADSEVFQILRVSVSVTRLFWSKRDREAAAEAAEALLQQCIGGGSLAGVACVRIIQALDSLGPDNPMVCFAEALSICRTANAIRVFVDVGVDVIPLLKQAVSHDIEPEFASKLIDIIEAEDRHRQTVKAKGVPVPQSSEFLSLRELEVLGLAAAGLSNREIAEKLTVSLNTAKTHMRNITEKLGASSRTQTIARARALKLI